MHAFLASRPASTPSVLTPGRGFRSDNGLKEGATVNQVMDALRIALPEAIGKARAENIARTEATTAFNQGRLAAFRETKGFVGAVEFMAITDARTTPICMERDGLVLAIDDPRLPDNTPPLHYMCRSVLSPVSGLELEDLGGKDYLDKQREKLEKLPPPLKGFGNEPGLEGGRPPGQPPVVRTPSGPKGTAGGEATERTRQPITVDAFPGDGGRIWTPVSGAQERRPSGIIVVKNPAIPDEHPVVRQILDSIGGLPDRVQMVLSAHGVQIYFTEASGFGPKPAGTPDDEWKDVVRLVMGKGAAVLTGFPEPDRISQVFITDILGMGTRNLPRVARHETGHAVYRALGLESDPDIEKAFVLESPRLRKSFQRSKSEFVAEGFDQYYSGWVARQMLWFSARRLHGIIGGKMIELRGQEANVLYQGAEGVVVGGGTGDNLCFTLDVGYGVEMAEIWPDGTMISYGGGEKKFSTITVSWPEEKVWTPEEAEPYKAFLRSKGVTLPHVMS